MAISDKLKTSFQKNMEQTIQNSWYKGDVPTGREVMGRIGQINKTDNARANDLYNQYKQLQNDATSPFYNPYTKATNAAVDNLKAMGVDTSNINDDWYQKNSWLKNYYTFSGTTNTPSKPGAKATAEQKAAYEYYQLAKSEEATKKVEQQWDALKEELTYWANRKDRNYSDDEIIGKVDWNKYKALTDMEDAARLGAPTELNRAVDFSRDNMYAVLWAARNDGGSGSMEGDLMYSAMGVGNQWKKNQNIADRLDPQSANYSPYSVGSTLEQEGLYFNRESFDQKWLDENRDILSGNDETAIKMYQSVYAAEQKTQKAEAEKAKFDAALERKLKSAKKPEDVVKWLDRMLGSSDYSTLKALNDSLGNGKLMDTTRAIDFSRADYVRKINEACERNNRVPDDDAVVEDVSSSVGVPANTEQAVTPDSTGKIGNIASAGGRLPAPTPEQKEINRANNDKLQEGYSVINDDMDAAGVTPAEEAVMQNAGSFNFRATTEYLKAVKGTKLDPWDRFSKQLIQKSAGATSTAVLENADTIAEYELAQSQIDGLYQRQDAMKAQLDENVLAGIGLSADDLDFYGKTDEHKPIRTTVDIDGTPVELQLVYEESAYAGDLSHKYYLFNDYEVDSDNPAVKAAVDEINRKWAAANAVQNLTEEQQAAVDQYKALQDQIDQTNDFLRDGKADYDEAVSRTEDAAKLREATIRLLTKVGADTSELENTTAVTGFFLDFTKYEPTQWMAYDTYADYAKRMTGKSDIAEFSDQVFAEAQAEDEKVMQALEVAQWSMDYANRKGIVLPDGVRNNFERYVAKLQRTHQDFEHLSYLAEPDFKEGVADGREIYARSRDWQENDTPENQPLWEMLTEEQQEDVENLWLNGSQADAASAYENYVSDIHMRGTFGLYQIDNLLTDIERDTWYYLLGTKGVKAAQDYFNYLADPDYGVLNTRSREYTEMAAQEMTDSGLLGFAAANTLSVLLSPVASVGSAIYALDYAGRRANGENPELNPDSPWLTANIFRNATRAESAEQIKETFKDAPVLQTLAQGGYEILTNRADSMMNAATFGSIFPWANGVSNEMLQEFLGASPMGMTAAMDAVAEAKRNGATDDQALGVAGATFFAETVTEAISLDNIKNAFAGGKEISTKTTEDFLKNWLTRSGISEMAGESINDIVEGAADYFIMGDNSEFSRMVQSYIADGMSEEDARAAAIRDEIGSLLHTALISYLSPGMDIVSFGAGRFHAYRNQTRVLQQNGYNVSVLDVMRMEREGRQERRNRPQPREQQPAQTAQAAPANEGSTQTHAPGRQTARDFDEAQRLAAEAEAAQRASDEEAVRDWEILETAKGADASVQSSSLAAVLDTGNTQESSDAASAAAVGLWQIFSRGQGNFLPNAMRSSLGDYDLTTPVQNIQRFIVGANEAGVNPAVVKEALQNAVLGGSESVAYQAVTSMQHASPADQARSLAATLEADNANPAVQQNKERAIHEWRVAEAEKQLIANGALDSARDGRDAADAAAQRTNTAQQELAERDAAVEAAGQAIAVAGDEIQKASGDPQRMAEAANQMTHAIAQKEHTVAVQGEYQQKLAKAVADQQAAEQKAKRIKDSAMKLIREQAEQAVAQEDQQRAEIAKAAEEQARVQARQQAEAKVEADATETENRLDAETIAGMIAPDATAEDIDTLARIIGEERQKLQQEDAQVEQTLPPEQKEKKKVDRKQRQRDKFREQVSKKFGVEIKVLDTTIGENGQKVNRQNGYYNPKTKSIVIDQETANDDLMYQVLTHEMTHLAEASETYDTLSGILLRNAYGNDSDRLAADIRIKKAQYDFALAQMHAQDSTISNEPLSPEDAAHEIVADLMGNLIKGDKQLIRQFATEEPSAARRFLESLKSFLKKALGMKGAWYDQAQQTVALFEEALNEVQGKTLAMPVRAATEVKGGTKVVRWADGSIRQFNSTADEIARNVLSTYKSNISIKSLSADIQAIRNKVIADDTSAPIDIQELAQQIAASAGTARGNGVSPLATALNNYFGKEIAISQQEADSLKRKYGSLAKANQALAATGVKAKMVVGADAGKALDLVFAGDVSSAEGNPAQFELANALGGDYAANMEDVLDRLEHTYSDPHADYLQEVGAGQNIDEATLALDVFDRLTDSIYGNVPYEAQQQKHSLVTNEDGESLADEFTGGTVAVNRQYSLKTWTEEEQNRVRRELLNVKGSDGKNLYTPEQVDKYLNDANGIASIIAADRSRLDFEASDNQVFLKPNNDYYFTLDASTLCAKRLLYQGTFDYVQHALPDEVFTPEDLIDLVNIMNQMGYETPCGICYVESRRRWLDTYAQKFLDELPDGDKPSIEDLTTSDGLERLRHNDPGMYKAFVDAMNRKGTANPKVVQLRTEYRGDIGKLTARDIQKVKDIGGLRIQSFSDFETPHLLDMVQAVMDMSAVGLTSQAYTKVPNFAWVFGDTGIKINLSLIGKGTGLDADGNLVFDNREGMNFDEAMRLRDRYSKNVGTILVGINDEHIIAAMGDPRIDFIIPFHKSGWSSEELRKMPTLNNYEDYTATQNEKKIKGRNKDNTGYDTIPGKQSKLVNFQPVGKNGYWDFSKSGEENSRVYLEMCAKDGRIPKFSQFLVDNGDGSFSLPEGNDKRSKAIREGYWKTLIDFKMYDNDGNGAEQTAVTPNINMAQAERVLAEHQLGRQMPDMPNGQKGAFIPMESNNSVPVAKPAGDVYIELIKQRRAGNNPTSPLDSLEASPSADIDVGSLGRSRFGEDASSEVSQNATVFGATQAPSTLGNVQNEQTEDYADGMQTAMAIDAETGETVQKRFSLPVTDEDTLRFLNDQEEKGEVTTTYRTMKLLDGKLVSPKASLINGKVEGDTQLGQWEEAAEHPELIKFDEDGTPYFELEEKGRKTKARYNPYMHSSNLMLNDQFTGAYQYSGDNKKLGRFVTVECIVPNSEAESGYQAQYAKDPVGWTNWKAGGVAQKNEQLGGERRRVFLSRWIKPVRIVPDSEVAQHYKQVLGDRDVEIPANVVTPSLLNELEKAGVKIGAPTSQQANKYRKMMGTKYSLPSDAPYLSAVERGETDEAQRMVDEYAASKGYTDEAYHGTELFGFTEFNTAATHGDIFVSYGKDLAASYSTNGEVKQISERSESPVANLMRQAANSTGDDLIGLINTIQDVMGQNLVFDHTDVYRLENIEYLGDGKYKADMVPKKGIDLEEKPGEVFSEGLLQGNVLKRLKEHFKNTDAGGIYRLYTRPGNQLVVDANGSSARAISVPWMNDTQTSWQIAEYAKQNGYDSVRINNVNDNGTAYIDMRREKGYDDIGIFFNSNDVKSADTVTYDADGNVIPLSERFTDNNPDIRYSLPSEDILRQVIRQYLRDGGSLALNTLDQYAAPLEGNNPNATSNRGDAQRQFGSRTLQQSDEIGAQAKQWIKERNAYTPDTNAAQLDRAIAWIRSNKTSDSDDGLYSSLQIVTNDNFDYRSADGQARMVALMGIAAAKGDVLAQTTLADAYNRQGTDLGRMLQARKMFLLMTPDGRKQSLMNMAKQVENEFLKKGYKKEIKFSDWVLDAAASAQTEEEFDRVRKAAAGEIAEQMPASWKEKLQGWRMLSMLGNPRTHIRNILGNLMFMPAVAVKNKVGALAEIVSRQDERTKTLGLASSEARAFAKEDAQQMQGILTGEAKYNEMTQIQQQRKTWGQGTGIISRTLGRGLQAVSDFNSGMLEKEDWIFLQRHYRNALAGYMTANHLTAADMKGTTLINARAYAVQEAQKATYRDANKLASTLSKIGREGRAAGFFVNAVLPFKKTPANILKRGLEYSPAGLLKAISADAYHLKRWYDYQDGKLAALPENALSPTQWIDRLASGLTGTGILALGAALCKAGFVTAGFGDDDDEFDRLEGDQEYALKLHVLGHDVSYTIDWAAPSCMPFFVGATIANTFGKDIEMDKLADALLGITEPVFNLSMLDGVNSLLDVNSYGEGNAITQIGEKVLTNYASSYVPTVAGQIARTIDTTRRKSYVESGASLSTIRYAIEQTENKIPFLSKTNIPYRNAWGEADVSPRGWAAIENFLSPGYGTTVEQDAVTEELRRLYQATGDKGMIPKLPSKTLSVNKETVKLNAEQYDQLTVDRGQTAKQTLEAIMQTAEWQMADDFTRADMVSDVWTYANQTANTRIDSGVNKTAWVAAAEKDGTIVASIVDRAVSRNQNEYVNGHKKSMLDSLEAGDIDTALTSIEALRDMGKKDTSIKSYITTYFKPMWQEAINDGRDGDAEEIESTLDELMDFTFDYSKWMTDEDEEPVEVDTDWLTKRN